MVVITAIIKSISQGNKSVIESKFIREELLRCSRSGNLTKIKKLADHSQILEITQIKDKDGTVVENFCESQDLIHVSSQPCGSDVLREWNPL